MGQPSIRVEGLKELRRDLKRAEQMDDLKELRVGLKKAADVVAQDARGRVPVGATGRARGSVRATAGGNRAFVVGGKAKVPYYGFLDFGSRNPKDGRPRSVGPWVKSGKGPHKGRFIYPALDAKEHQVVELVSKAVSDALNKLGL